MVRRHIYVIASVWLGCLPSVIRAQTPEYAIPEVTVAVNRDWCPAPDDPNARQAISEAAKLYSDPSSFDRVGVEARSVRRRVAVESVGRSPVPPSVTPMTHGSTKRGRDLWLNEMARGTFARHLAMSSLDGRFETWEYPPLYGDLGYYFFTPAFLGAHTFGILDRDSRQIGFCAVARRNTFIDGRIILGDDGSIISVDWTYATPDPDEGAGGRAEFDPSQGPPLPTTGVFWRRLALGDFQEWTDEYSAWSVQGAS